MDALISLFAGEEFLVMIGRLFGADRVVRFQTFLLALGPDRQSAGERYEQIRRLLITFFGRYDQWNAEELADISLDRLAMHIGRDLDSLRSQYSAPLHLFYSDPPRWGSLNAFAASKKDAVFSVPDSTFRPDVLPPELRRLLYLVAHRVRSAHFRSRRGRSATVDPTDIEEALRRQTPTSSFDLEQRADVALALRTLSHTDQSFLVEYYESDPGALARSLGVSPAALNQRARRLTEKLRKALKSGPGISFKVFHPLSVIDDEWHSVLAYVHVPRVRESVERDSQARLVPYGEPYGSYSAHAARRLPKGSGVTVSMVLPGCEVNPPFCSFRWLEDKHLCEFRFRKSSRKNPKSDRLAGRVIFQSAGAFVGEVNFTMSTTTQEIKPAASIRGISTSRPYQIVFISYSRKDTSMAEKLERTYVGLGIECSRDVRFLHVGEVWSEAILRAIDGADIFQLLWSCNARKSECVKREWKHAVELQRPFFIRPIYWQLPLEPIPKALKHIHFAYVAP